MTPRNQFSQDDLEAALEQGVISPEDLQALLAFFETRRLDEPEPEEMPRLVSGLGDVFTTIATGLLLGASAWLLALVKEPLGMLGLAIGSWLLGQVFTLRRRLALPSFLCALLFVVGAAGFVVTGMMQLTHEPSDFTMILFFISAGVVGVLASALHWHVYHVPVVVAAGTAAAVGAIVAVYGVPVSYRLGEQALVAIVFLLGLCVFMYALRWDRLDLKRRGRAADVAFYLHLLAAPMLVHPIYSQLDLFGKYTNLIDCALAVGVYFNLALLALIIDRRATLLAGLVYLIAAVAQPFYSKGGQGDEFVALMFLSMLITSAILLLLGLYWLPARRFLLTRMPPSVLRAVPPLPEC